MVKDPKFKKKHITMFSNNVIWYNSSFIYIYNIHTSSKSILVWRITALFFGRFLVLPTFVEGGGGGIFIFYFCGYG